MWCFLILDALSSQVFILHLCRQYSIVNKLKMQKQKSQSSDKIGNLNLFGVSVHHKPGLKKILQTSNLPVPSFFGLVNKKASNVDKCVSRKF